MGFRGVWVGMVFAGLLSAGCAPTATERNSVRIWDTNYLSKDAEVVQPKPVQPIMRTAPVSHVPGTVAIWPHPMDGAKSLVIGTDNSRQGGLVVFGLDGHVAQKIPVRLPYGVQVQTAFNFGRRSIDIALVIEREPNRLRIFGINGRKGRLWEVTGETELLPDSEPGNGAMGLCLLQQGHKTYAIVSRKSNYDGGGILEMYSLIASEGRVNARRIRQFGEFTGRGVVEAIAADSYYGLVMYFDGSVGVRKYPAMTDQPKELMRFGSSGWADRCVALGIVPGTAPGSGLIVAADFQDHLTPLRLFRRKGEIDQPDQNRELPQRPTLASSRASGLAVISQALPRYPEGMVVVGDETNGTFDFYSWRDIRTQHGSTSVLLR